MNQERSHSRKNTNWHGENNNQARKKYQVSLTKLLEVAQNNEQSSNFPQSTPLHQPLWFWAQHSGWSYLNRGLFWGVIVSLTSVCSAIAGVALTRIDAVERTIVQKLNPNALNSTSVAQKNITRPMNVLLIEVKPDADAMVEFSDTFVGESKAILLLKVKPEQNSAQVINIPQNSQVEIPRFGRGTIKDAYQLGGTKLLSETVSQLTPNSPIDYYIRATPATFRDLTASGKIKLEDCDSRIEDCSDLSKQVIRQQTTFKKIRQRLNIPGYLASFTTAITEGEANLDTNISRSKIISLANFVKELEPKNIKVDLLSGYTPGLSKTQDKQIQKSPSIKQKKQLAAIRDLSQSKNNPFQYHPIAVQNTTNNPELGKQIVAYLRHQNFRDVYLVKQIPLKLNQTRIVTNHSQAETANYLRNILGFGHLKAKSNSPNRELILQIGEDALYLPTNYRSYQ